MTRRALLRAMAGMIAFRRASAIATADPSAALLAELMRHFDYLQFADEAPERYARLYVARYGVPDLGRERTRAQIHLQFLSSTDFFQHGADQKRAVRFVALYDPYVTPCYNPFR